MSERSGSDQSTPLGSQSIDANPEQFDYSSSSSFSSTSEVKEKDAGITLNSEEEEVFTYDDMDNLVE